MIDAVTYFTNDAIVDHVRDTLAQAGLYLARLEPGSVSMMRGYLTSRALVEPVAVLTIAQKHTDLCIHDGRSVRSMRRIPSGWTDVVPQPRAISPFYTYEDEANGAGADDTSKYQGGDGGLWPFAPGEEPPPGVSEFQDPVRTARQPQPEALPAARDGGRARGNVATEAGFLASEISRSLAFFAREYPEAPKPLSIYLLAPKDAADKLTTALSAALPLPVKSGDPLAELQLPRAVHLSKEGIGDGLLPAAGCAIGGDDASLPSLDLSRQLDRVKAGRRAPAVLLAGMAGSTVWMVAAAITSITLTLLESNLRAEDGRVRAQTQRIKDSRALLLKRAETNSAAKALQAKSQVPASSVLGRIAAATPSGIAVKRIAISADGKMTIEGDAIDSETLAQFGRNVSQSVAIRFPNYDAMRQDDTGALSFRMAGITRTAPAAASGPANPNGQ
jgi:hypothetical protein